METAKVTNQFGNPILTSQQKEDFMVSVARGEGLAAYYGKKQMDDCPYEGGSTRYWAWVRSFMEAGKEAVNV